ncbi:MAG: hypothetical protein HY300_06840 [Verrucomicrobia bacterium]|nr:hypothetical protein [Verrucomicrobiota bacterium]
MPIRINLLAEQQAEEEARRRDPAKRAAFVATLLAVLMGLWAGSLYLKVSGATRELDGIESALKQLEKQAGVTRTNLADIGRVERKMDALDALATNRFLWAPQLDVLQRVISSNIQLTRLKADQRYSATAAEKSSDPKKPGKRASVAERIALTIEGRDFGRIEDEHYRRFKEQLVADAYFRTIQTNENNVNFRGFSPPMVEGGTNYFKFTLESTFPEKVRY